VRSCPADKDEEGCEKREGNHGHERKVFSANGRRFDEVVEIDDVMFVAAISARRDGKPEVVILPLPGRDAKPAGDSTVETHEWNTARKVVGGRSRIQSDQFGSDHQGAPLGSSDRAGLKVGMDRTIRQLAAGDLEMNVPGVRVVGGDGSEKGFALRRVEGEEEEEGGEGDAGQRIREGLDSECGSRSGQAARKLPPTTPDAFRRCRPRCRAPINREPARTPA